MNLIAYGSLMNQSSLEATLSRKASLRKITIRGFQRVFNAPFDGHAFLNLEPKTGTVIEGAFFGLKPAEIILFAEREAGSELIEVWPGYFAFVWPKDYCRELPVLQSYIDVCQVGAEALGIDMTQGLSRPKTIINDSKSPFYV